MIDATCTPQEIHAERLRHVELLRQADEEDQARTGYVTGASYPQSWRDAIKLDFSQCDHTTTHLVEVKAIRFEVPTWAEIQEGVATQEIDLGIWGMEVCLRCGTVTRKECPHVKTEWLFDGKLLVCTNCGVNCT